MKGESAESASLRGVKPEEESLVARARSSPEALEGICELYMPRVYRYVLRRVGRVEDAEDITSTVFEKVILNIHNFDGRRASFSTWVFRITLNSVADHFRYLKKKKEAYFEETSANVMSAGEGDLERLDLYVVLMELLRGLPAKYQEAVTLRYFADMKVMELAEALGISETAASKRVLRGLEMLEKQAAGTGLQELL